MLAAMTGAGKSTLYHVLIMGLALRYSPEELRMYLVDGKFGTEFRPYARLPHASVVSLNSPAELSRSVLKELHDEMVRRNEMFRASGVEDIGRYRDASGKPLARLLLLIDEYHQLFDEDRDGAASDLLRRLAQQGRSAGIHMFLGSQRFGAPGMLHQKDIFGNTHLKVAMKMAPDEVQALSEFGAFGKSVIRACDVAGKFAMNDSGRDEETIAGRAALLEASARDGLIEELRELASARGVGGSTVVFRGDRPPEVSDNPALVRLLRSVPRPTAKELEGVARQEQGPRGGFGQPAWSAGDRPLGLWLGRELNVHGHAMAMLRRAIAQNLLIVGSHAGPRGGMLLGCVASLAALHGAGQVRVRALHAGNDEEDASLHSLEQGAREYARACGIEFSVSRDAGEVGPMLAQATAELDRRLSGGAKQEPGLVLILAEPDRLGGLRRAGDAFTRASSPAYESLRRLLAEGPPAGIHVIVLTPTLRQLGQVLDERRDLPLFAHRASLQVSEDDSFALFRSRKASQLQSPGDAIALALYANVETNQAVRFKPYAPARSLAAELDASPAGAWAAE
jgi:S-DNA-T family DNA segregation ATPase FtsK/SpoIIIE